MRLCRVTAAWTESFLSCILHYTTKYGRKKNLTMDTNIMIAKEAQEKRTIEFEKEECKTMNIPEISEGDT